MKKPIITGPGRLGLPGPDGCGMCCPGPSPSSSDDRLPSAFRVGAEGERTTTPKVVRRLLAELRRIMAELSGGAKENAEYISHVDGGPLEENDELIIPYETHREFKEMATRIVELASRAPVVIDALQAE